jgi:hypothetical protein
MGDRLTTSSISSSSEGRHSVLSRRSLAADVRVLGNKSRSYRPPRPMVPQLKKKFVNSRPLPKLLPREARRGCMHRLRAEQDFFLDNY